jgi:hypothetical protein
VRGRSLSIPRSVASVLLGMTCAVAVGSACRSVSVEFGTVPAQSTGVAPPTQPALAPLAAAQPPTAPAFRATNPPAATPAAPTSTPVPENTPAPVVPSFAPRGEGQSRSGVIENSKQRDRYQFDGRQGQLVEVRAKRTSGVTLAPRIELVDPSGAREAEASVPNTAEQLVERKLASTGAYTIVISPFQGAGPYSVTWFLDRYGQLASGGRVNAEIADPYQKDRFRFEATQGQLLSAHVERTAGVSLQPWINLIDPSGASESSADSWPLGQVTVEWKLASSGTYMLVVGGQNTGPYLVTLSIH